MLFKRKCFSPLIHHFLLHLLMLSLWFSGAVGFLESFTEGFKGVFNGGIQSLGNLYCSSARCCEFHLNDNVEERLAYLLNDKLYGQHVARSLILEAVSSHTKSKPQKALGIGLHGWTGTGKNYVSQMIAESLFKKGMKSPLVHVFAGRASFPVDAEVDTYKKNLLGWIRGNVSQCGHSLFIFDECDKWPMTLLDVIRPFLDYHSVIEGVDYRNTIFLFLTNSGGSAVGNRMLELHEEGIIREQLRFEDFHHEISLSLFNEEGGFFRSEIIRGDGIDFHIPFLPMEERHVKMCTLNQFKFRGYANPSEDMIMRVLQNMKFGPDGNPIFSMTGCKHVRALVTSVMAGIKLEL